MPSNSFEGPLFEPLSVTYMQAADGTVWAVSNCQVCGEPFVSFEAEVTETIVPGSLVVSYKPGVQYAVCVNGHKMLLGKQPMAVATGLVTKFEQFDAATKKATAALHALSSAWEGVGFHERPDGQLTLD